MKELGFTALVTFIATGVVACEGSGGGGNSGEDCASNLLAGDLVITEILANPSGADEGNEYFEIFNPSTSPVDLTGLALIASRDDGMNENTHVMRSTTIAAGQYFVIGGVLDEFKPSYVDYGAANDLTLRNSKGRLALQCQGNLVDEVTYESAPDGASLELNGAEAPNHIRNDEAANFCTSEVEFNELFKGTPGMANSSCGNVVQGMCDDNGTMRETVKPTVGDVIVTELMPNPEGSDGDGEWIEVLALADFDLNGLGVQRGDGGSGAPGIVNSATCLPITAGNFALFVSNDDTATNGGLPSADATFKFSLIQSNGTIDVTLGETILDTVTWSSSSSGVSINLDPGSNSAVDNNDEANFCPGSTAYGDKGNLGTTGTTNTACISSSSCLDEGGTSRAVVKPVDGDLKITEWMANPKSVSDTKGEWFEVLVTANIDLNGIQVGSKAGQVAQTIVDTNCIPITAGTSIIFARNNDPLLNGGLPRVDGRGVALNNVSGRIFVGVDDVELDALMYSNPASGDSTQIDDANNTCLSSASLDKPTYGDGDSGSPGAANSACPL